MKQIICVVLFLVCSFNNVSKSLETIDRSSLLHRFFYINSYIIFFTFVEQIQSAPGDATKSTKPKKSAKPAKATSAEGASDDSDEKCSANHNAITVNVFERFQAQYEHYAKWLELIDRYPKPFVSHLQTIADANLAVVGAGAFAFGAEDELTTKNDDMDVDPAVLDNLIIATFFIEKFTENLKVVEERLKTKMTPFNECGWRKFSASAHFLSKRFPLNEKLAVKVSKFTAKNYTSVLTSIYESMKIKLPLSSFV